MEEPANLETVEDGTFVELLKLIHALTGITIATNRKSMVVGRLRKRVSILNLSTYEDYLARVKRDPDEKIVFIDLVTTNETYFFRTPRIWAYIIDVYLPIWMSRNADKPFLAWSAAASSGEEAHSLGVLLQSFKELNPKFTFRILGTDISREMVQRCNKGLYRGRSIDLFSKTKPDLFKKYMRESGDSQFQVAPEIKNRIQFKEHNLFNPLRTQDVFDLILIRNVLIYFTGADQERALALIEPRLCENGLLVIGESESLSSIKTGYSSIQPLLYQRLRKNTVDEVAA